MPKIPNRFRMVLFAFVMSSSTALIVSGIIMSLHANPHVAFATQWLSAFISAWPIVFVAILIIAPMVNKLLNLFVEAP